MLSDSLTGWYSRAEPHPSPEAFAPSRESLLFAAFRSAQVGESLTAALFSPNIAVDAMGRVLVVQQSDFSGLAALAKQVLDLPNTGNFQNQWRVYRRATCRPIEKSFVTDGDGDLVQTGVYGFVGDGPRVLSAPVGEYTELPQVLSDLFSLALEAREGYVAGKGDRQMIERVTALVGAR